MNFTCICHTFEFVVHCSTCDNNSSTYIVAPETKRVCELKY